MPITPTNTLGVLFNFILLLRAHQRPEKKVAWCSILSLPDEVLSRILHDLDCLSILAARLTCRRLYATSRSPLLWRFKALEVSYTSGIPLLEEPVENYTSEELEQKIVTRARISQRWRKLDPTNLQQRQIDVGRRSHPIYECRLLPGGRWLLINENGIVSITDLDPPKAVRQTLFDVSSSTDPLTKSEIWIDPTKYWLSPRIALHCSNTSEHQGSSRICVYQLNSTGRGSNMKWSSEEIITIQTSARGMKDELRLDNEYVLEQCMHRDERGYFFKLYIYRYSDGLLRLRECECDPESTVLLLPHSRIGVITQTHIKVSVINPVGSDGLTLQPIFSTLLDPIFAQRRPYRLHSTFYHSHLRLVKQDCMLEIQFPHDTNEVYQKKITLAHGTFGTSAIEGPSLFIRLLKDRFVDFIFYEVEESYPGQAASQIRIPADVFPTSLILIACDVASGRVITSRYSERTLLQL